MGKKLVVSFPGVRGVEIPLLYFGAKHYEDMGWDTVFVGPPAPGEYNPEVLFENASKVLSGIDFNDYEEIVFIAKSLGTVIACVLKERLAIPASLILLTPLKETLPYINSGNDVLLVAAGDKDKYMDAEVLKAQCEKENINCYIERGVGHRMEVDNDLERNLEVISNVLRCLQ